MICAYCGKEARGTKEHIISSGILDLFPECYITNDSIRNKIYVSDPMVKDVCADCNNHRLSYIDSYAKAIIEKYFLQKYERDAILDFEYDYTLIQKMCIKYAFNDSRSRKYDTSFFDRDIIDWLLDKEDRNHRRNITIMAGLAVNTSPIPDYFFGNNKLRWSKDPLLLANSLVEHLEYETGLITPRKNIDFETFNQKALSYLFRFNSLQLIMMCWDPEISDEDLETNKIVLGVQYPYVLLNQIGKSSLERCTSEMTYHLERIIDVTWGQNIMDEISYMRGTFSEKSQNYIKLEEKVWQEEEKKIAKEHPRH